jgi:hypothetical protein
MIGIGYVMDIPEFTIHNKMCLYVITEGRHKCLARMLTSLNLSTYLPGYICVVTPDKDTPTNFDVSYAASQLRRHGVRLDFIGCEASAGLSKRKNIALDYMQVFDCEYGLAVDDDMVFDFHAIQDMHTALLGNDDLFAVGPVVLHQNRTGLPRNEHTWDETMVRIEDGVWKWGGHRQGVVPELGETGVVDVQHMAAVFLHRYNEEDRYDETYDRPIYFLYDSDFLYGRKLAVCRSSIVHHWPTTTGPNLQDNYAAHEADILYNAQYFAQKHGLGEVTQFSWVGYEKPKAVN